MSFRVAVKHSNENTKKHSIIPNILVRSAGWMVTLSGLVSALVSGLVSGLVSVGPQIQSIVCHLVDKPGHCSRHWAQSGTVQFIRLLLSLFLSISDESLNQWNIVTWRYPQQHVDSCETEGSSQTGAGGSVDTFTGTGYFKMLYVEDEDYVDIFTQNESSINSSLVSPDDLIRKSSVKSMFPHCFKHISLFLKVYMCLLWELLRSVLVKEVWIHWFYRITAESWIQAAKRVCFSCFIWRQAAVSAVTDNYQMKKQTVAI